MSANGFGRALRYFIRQAELYEGFIFLFGLFMAVYMSFINGVAMSFRGILQAWPNMLLFVALLVILTTNMAIGQSWGMLISFGCRRSNTFFGSLVMNLLLVAQSLFLYEILVRMFQAERMFRTSVLLAFYLATEGISQLTGITATKWGKFVVAILAIVLFGMGLTAVILVGVVAGDAEMAPVLSGAFMLMQQGQGWLLFAGIAVCIAANIASYRIIRNYEVKV